MRCRGQYADGAETVPPRKQQWGYESRLSRETPVEISFRYSNRMLRCDASIKTILPAGAGFLFEKMDARTRQAIDTLVGELEAVAQGSTLRFISHLDHADTRVGHRP